MLYIQKDTLKKQQQNSTLSEQSKPLHNEIKTSFQTKNSTPIKEKTTARLRQGFEAFNPKVSPRVNGNKRIRVD